MSIRIRPLGSVVYYHAIDQLDYQPQIRQGIAQYGEINDHYD